MSEETVPRGNELVTSDEIRKHTERIFHKIHVSLVEWSIIGNDLLGAATKLEQLETALAKKFGYTKSKTTYKRM